MFDMMPPSAALLEECPRFESLHKKLTLSFLDQDGTIKSELSSSSIRQNDLYNTQAELLRESLLLQSLQSLMSSEDLPREVQMILAQSFLDSEELYALNGGVRDSQQINKNDSKLIETSLRKDLAQQLKLLKSLDDDNGNIQLSEICRQRAEKIMKFRDTLTQSQLSLVTTMTQILETANTVIKLLRTNLDMNRHGQSERTIKLFTEYLVAISKGLQSKLEATSDELQSSLYTKEILSILNRIRNEAQSIQQNLVARGQYLEKSLERYSSAGPEYERIVKEYLRTHVSILRCEEEIEELKAAKSRKS